MELKGHKVEFDSETHTYKVDGCIVPSITTILKPFFDDYVGVPEEILERAAMLGTEMHKEIEEYEKDNIIPCMEEVFNYIDIKNKYGIINIENEIPVLYEEDGKVLFVGTLDQVYQKDNKVFINDFKRNVKLNIEKISLQVSMYKLGYEYTYDKKIDGLSVMQLRKNVAKLLELEYKEKEIKDLLKVYYCKEN